jgi:Low-density lipoprotein receptor domain class A
LPSIPFSPRNRTLFALLAGLVLIACSDGGGGGGSLAALGIDDGASSGLSKSGTASPEKSIKVGLDTGALVEIPAGAVTKDVKVSLERPADGKALELVNRLPKAEERVASAPYVLTPHGTKFQHDVTVKLPLAKPDARGLAVAWLEDEDDKTWKVLAAPEVEGDKAVVKLRHFSVLLLIDEVWDLELDAGTSNAGSDGAASDVDAGGDTEDAESPDEGEDAESMVERDAAAVEIDAGTGEDDASDGTPEAGGAADGGVRSDASTGHDAGPDGSVLLTRLSQCGMVSQQGLFYDPLISNPISQCHYRCVLDGTCSDLESLYCFGGEAGYSSQTYTCFESCSPTPFTCPDQTLGAHCDGYLDCVNGEDEVGCDPSYVDCGGGLHLPSATRCDGDPDCPGAQDEIGCRVHLCDGGFAIAIELMCDGFVDCSDGSDEPASCAIVMCGVDADAAVGL